MNALLMQDPRFPYPVRAPDQYKPELFCLVHHFSVDRRARIAQYGLETVKEVGPETWVRIRNLEPEAPADP